MAVNLNMAFISPPVGFSLFYLQSVAPPEVKTADIHKGALPFMGLQIVALFILGIVPGITNFSYCFFNPNAPPELCRSGEAEIVEADDDSALPPPLRLTLDDLLYQPTLPNHSSANPNRRLPV